MRRILVQLAGTRRNARSGKGASPGLQLARSQIDGEAIAEVEIVADPSDPKSLSVAAELATDVKTSKRYARVRQAAQLEHPTDAHDLEVALEQLARVARDIAKRHRGHANAVEFLVSAESGTPAQQVALASMLHQSNERLHGNDRWGFRTALVLVGDDAVVRLPYPPPSPVEAHLVHPSDRDGMLAHLAQHLPPARPVLITGPTGSGKSLAAHELHERWFAKKRTRPFEHVNCAALPEDLLEAELFGVAAGAATGVTPRNGAFVDASEGTLFLDEIGELPLRLQAKLLVTLQPRDGAWPVRPLGGAARGSRARIILATNRDLDALVREGRFRDDLLARISAHVLALPPLAEQPHQALAAYLRQLATPQLGATGTPNARFHLEQPAWRRLARFAFDASTPWRWNYRDVTQSADRLIMRARSQGRRASAGTHWIRIADPLVEAEIADLKTRWTRAAESPPSVPLSSSPTPAPPDPDAAWKALSAALAPGVFDELSELERWEARYLHDAKRATRTNADAWRWLHDRQLIRSKTQTTNPSAAYSKRWSRYRWSEE